MRLKEPASSASPHGEASVAIEKDAQSKPAAMAAKAKPGNPFSAMDETWEYEYKFGQHSMSETEPFTVGRLFRKIFNLFFPGRSSHRY